MARSVKKGPFIDDHLMKKITKLNSENQKNRSRPGPEEVQFFRIWLVIP
ncbi:ribosomal protein S19 domain protein [Leptospira borgpetersenii str. 200701203]|uniref:Small ribosomal subunit protein uS19 n=1 Tax=Leptospira borgpetersenii str. 200701203 TaxID=1193007 RepID=M3GH40_LEPBO|nr:ribosomal protein S19 domain protein [Leptospira borgpetersenii str. 200701203]